MVFVALLGVACGVYLGTWERGSCERELLYRVRRLVSSLLHRAIKAAIVSGSLSTITKSFCR